MENNELTPMELEQKRHEEHFSKCIQCASKQMRGNEIPTREEIIDILSYYSPEEMLKVCLEAMQKKRIRLGMPSDPPTGAHPPPPPPHPKKSMHE